MNRARFVYVRALILIEIAVIVRAMIFFRGFLKKKNCKHSFQIRKSWWDCEKGERSWSLCTFRGGALCIHRKYGNGIPFRFNYSAKCSIGIQLDGKSSSTLFLGHISSDQSKSRWSWRIHVQSCMLFHECLEQRSWAVSESDGKRLNDMLPTLQYMTLDDSSGTIFHVLLSHRLTSQ